MNMDLVLQQIASELGVKFMSKAAQPMTTAGLNSRSLMYEDAEKFINQVVNESVFLQSIRVHRTNMPSGSLSKLSISGPVTRKTVGEATEYTETRKPSNTVVEYATVKTTSAIDISGETTEDNIEGPSGKQTIMQAMINQIANDHETLAIEGDDSIAGTTDMEMLLKANDGFLIKTDAGTGAHIVDAAGKRASLRLLSKLKRTMPTKWRRDLTKLRYIMSANVAEDIAEELANVGNGNFSQSALTDTMRTSGGLPNLFGIPSLVVPLIPEDLTIDGTSGDTGSFIWLVNPMNFIYVVQRDLTVEWERKPRKDVDEGTVHMRTDFIVEEPDAVVRADNVNTDTTVARYAAL